MRLCHILLQFLLSDKISHSIFPFVLQQRKHRAEEIYEEHLKPCASLPVNVDSTAIKDVEANLQDPSTELFSSLQYQVNTSKHIKD